MIDPGRDHCRLCRHYQSECVSNHAEPLDEWARCGLKRKAVEYDDLCNDFSPSLWGVMYKNSKGPARPK